MPFADGTRAAGLARLDAPTEAHSMVLALRMEPAADAFYDWQGGLIWLRMDDDPEAEALRRLIRSSSAAAMRRWCAPARALARRRCPSSSRSRRRSPRCRRG